MFTSVYDFLCATLCRYCGTQVVTCDWFMIEDPEFLYRLLLSV